MITNLKVRSQFFSILNVDLSTASFKILVCLTKFSEGKNLNIFIYIIILLKFSEKLVLEDNNK